ncbi:tyrosine-type recombinase/integrase [Nocardia pseudobrasiliensis]|uniref:Phage integrase family protein n=1 Tax=Nocardia pseudobrasiliensis TaxID=45979 RepID=A0A370HPA4_9NOCA|nr:tyrosine-type recombinase/integrase [Nocardia pseudobrasiliensis]RDI60277.1 phage integrase family protein [Nocardia pseudobrasiliensis]
MPSTSKKPKTRAPRRAFGRIRKLPSGRIQAAYIGPDLALHKAPHTFDTKDRAEGWIADERRLVDLGIWTSPADRAAEAAEAEKSDQILFGDYAERVIATRVSRRGKPLARRTVDSYNYLLREHLNPTFETTAVDEITYEMVRDWYSSVARIRPKGRKSKSDKDDAEIPTARARAYEVLRMVLNVAVDDDLIDKNPCRIKGATAVQPAHDATVLLPAEIEALAAAMPDELAASVLLAAWCGLRPSETFELRRRNLNADCSVLTVAFAATYREQKIVIDRPKAGSTGDVVIPDHIRPAIRNHLASYVDPSPDALLFPDPDTGKTMREWIYRRTFNKACTAIGRPDFRPGEQRHTGGTVAAQAGGTLPEVMERLRHKTPQAAMRYQKIAAGRAQTLAENISKLAKAADTKSADDGKH